MHPAGIQFGLSRGLLQFRGEEVLLADVVLEELSREAQFWQHLKKPPIHGNFLVDLTIRAADKLLDNNRGTSREITPFFTGLNKVMYFTLCRVAERAGVATTKPDRLFTNEDMWSDFCARAAEIELKPGRRSVRQARLQRSLFKICRDEVKKRCAQNDPNNVRHADLIALFMFNFWNATGLAANHPQRGDGPELLTFRANRRVRVSHLSILRGLLLVALTVGARSAWAQSQITKNGTAVVLQDYARVPLSSSTTGSYPRR
jgi:hypothetical protein